ncbi:hypothetical protein AC578_5596 [Pseudocercospora eumusae]|uniref:Histidine-specific methyltransferase SAM-dependent domain-containing protein n=1 Tax=Pseudocercospora eumusae TaxID=321146 RepID=A0A139HTF7_9PEZI|nr:hypothetical protein AC578_5596 [Pseudocercospora eumusae]
MSSTSTIAPSVDVLNLRGLKTRNHDAALRDQIVQNFLQAEKKWLVDESGNRLTWTKSFPIAALYEGDGISLYEDITRSDGYYLYREEISIIHDNKTVIASCLLDQTDGDLAKSRVAAAYKVEGAIQKKRSRQDSAIEDSSSTRTNWTDSLSRSLHLSVIDMGAGRPDKALVLLEALHSQMIAHRDDRAGFTASYYAVDLQHDDLRIRLANAVKSKPFLCSEDSKPETASSGPKIDVHGVCASYLDALEALNFRFSQAPAFNSGETEHRKCLLWLGSSFTNFEPGEAVALLRSFAHTAELRSRDCILIGIDCCQDPHRLSAAYGSQSAQWRKYAQNGIRNAANILGNEASIKMQSAGEWEYVARWDALRKRHVRFMKAPRNMSFDVAVDQCSKSKCSIKICKGEHIFLSQSYKYDHRELEMLFRDAGLVVSNEWSNERGDSLLFLLTKM